MSKSEDKPDNKAKQNSDSKTETQNDKKPKEIGGPKVEPTTYGDWQQKGRCTDF
ncbi:MAG: DUF1674 domain-containing protein [Rickettsiales bacterium]|nr:DUF1674 domain-containing protein [Rickettsiales bacterium]